MRIPCPCCGPRDVGEFTMLGDAAPARPAGMATSLEAMVDYVYLRDNPAGVHEELWYHSMGCRSWLVVTRDTRTHVIGGAVFAIEVAHARKAEETRS